MLIPSCELCIEAYGVVMSLRMECPLISEQGAFELKHSKFKGVDDEHSTKVENEHRFIFGDDRRPGGLQQRWRWLQDHHQYDKHYASCHHHDYAVGDRSGRQ